MKQTIKIFFLLVAVIAFAGCQSSEHYDSLPEPVAQFVSQYWPNPDISSYAANSDGGCTVIINSGPTVVFDRAYSWTSVKGNGLPLPQTFLYNELPEQVYDYLESGSLLNDVFDVSRTAREYRLTLLNFGLVYDLQSQQLRQVSVSS